MLFWSVLSPYSSASCLHDQAVFLAHQILRSLRSRSSFAFAFTVQFGKLCRKTQSISVMFLFKFGLTVPASVCFYIWLTGELISNHVSIIFLEIRNQTSSQI